MNRAITLPKLLKLVASAMPFGPLCYAFWLQDLLNIHNSGRQLETATQRTGGGGLQFVFTAPAGWTPPTFRTDMGIDIRGVGGFAVMPPSIHETGNYYAWLPGK